MKKIFSSIWFLSLIIAVPVIVFFPPVFEKYRADLGDVRHNSEQIFQIYFVDLNSDGVNEKVRTYADGNNCFTYSRNGKLKWTDKPFKYKRTTGLF